MVEVSSAQAITQCFKVEGVRYIIAVPGPQFYELLLQAVGVELLYLGLKQRMG
jgi:hypothetical protein